MKKQYTEFESEVFAAGGNLGLQHYSCMGPWETAYEQDWGIRSIAHKCHQMSVDAGWWHDTETWFPLEISVPEKLCLIHSEISEAMEGDRKSLMDDKLPHRKMTEVELADAVIRIFDLARALDLDVPGAMIEKMIYNKTRADHSAKSRSQENGKKY